MRASAIRAFLASPTLRAAPTARDQEQWNDGLDALTIPALNRVGHHPLRGDQLEAWRGIAGTPSALLLGPPGTGKTFTLAWMGLSYLESRRTAGLPCRILVTGFTRNAIANVLESVAEKATRILGVDVPVAFLGRPPETGLAEGVDGVWSRHLSDFLSAEHLVLGATTWQIHRALRSGDYGGPRTNHRELFDLLCLDEASQMRVGQALMALAPLKEAARVVVAGDDRQLAPIGQVGPWEFDERNLAGSLYSFLQGSGIPEFQLVETFRLNRPLAATPARYFYDEFRSAVPVAERRLRLSDGWMASLEPWQKLVLDPEYPVCVLLHDGPPAATRNPVEASLVSDLARVLGPRLRDEQGAPYSPETLWESGLAVVTPHRAQNAEIRARLESTGVAEGRVVETVDRIQGRERDAILMSYTVSDPEFAAVEGPFLFAPERFNVAITRARNKLVVVLARALLEVVPPDEEVLNAIDMLREFVFECEAAGTFTTYAGSDRPVEVQVRLLRFDDDSPIPNLAAIERDDEEPAPELTPALDEALAAVRELAEANATFGTTRSFEVDRRVARKVAFAEYRELLRAGQVRILGFKASDYGGFWFLRPADDGVVPIAASPSLVRDAIGRVVADAQGGRGGARYLSKGAHRGVRDYFVWCDPDGNDVLRPVLLELEREGVLRFGTDRWDREVVESLVDAEAPEPPPDPSYELNDLDFRLLNLLEDLEARSVNFGVFESWTLPPTLRREANELGFELSHRAIERALARLHEHGWVMRDEVDRVRSRMAELAREVRFVKQRFGATDADRRPYVVRSLKLLARNRDKPVRDESVADLMSGLCAEVGKRADVARVLSGLEPALRRAWRVPASKDLTVAGFQARSIRALFVDWMGGRPTRAVITADTGSGKTEAACLPLILGSAVDRLTGVQGVRVLLVYPRIRLAVNQARRLAHYAAELGRELGMVLTVGLQAGPVPNSWVRERERYERDPRREERLFQPIDERHWRFPFFTCPACEEPLLLQPGPRRLEGDTLQCTATACGWSFSGWAGAKERLRAKPPALLLMVTESLHQWQQDPRAGAIFGDGGDRAAPRAVVADEVHLYSLVHGAQVGYALRRLLQRVVSNGEASPMAIAMSATLGEAPRVWAELVGASAGEVLHLQPRPTERRDNPRGREYFYFVQPEVESRGRDVAGDSTTIQSLMCLAHGMRRRTGRAGGFRSLVFLDSLDKVKRLLSDYRDAETNGRLHRYRTTRYGRDPQTNTPRSECCGQPASCDRFRDGECWYFAATDQRQRGPNGVLRPGDSLAVAPTPIFSETRGSAEEVINRSDVIFATSSLEVGFDDPDVTLVYQHYAPQNLASFVQRKGRGGRGADDRPVTGVTLSLQSSRDSYYFRRPARMLEAADHRVPINMGNPFVRRGQVLSLVLDVAARSAYQHGDRAVIVDDGVLTAADAQVRELFGDHIYVELDVTDLEELWARALEVRDPLVEARVAAGEHWRGLREQLAWIPTTLFESINLPVLTVLPEGESRTGGWREDIGLAMTQCAPGRMTRRWGMRNVHWVPFAGPRAPMLSGEGLETDTLPLAPGQSQDMLAALLPLEVREAFEGTVHPGLIRPTTVRPRVAGQMVGTQWEPAYSLGPGDNVLLGDRGAPLNHKTRGGLLGFLIVSAGERLAGESRQVPSLRGLARPGVGTFLCDSNRRTSGLAVTQAYWASDVELISDVSARRRERSYRRQLFVDPSTDTPQLWGYRMQPEGVQLELDSDFIDRFVTRELADLRATPARRRWHAGQFLRYLVMTRSGRHGLNRYQARELAELMITAAADPGLRERLLHALRRWSSSRFVEVLRETRDVYLTEHPLLTEEHWTRLQEAVANRELGGALRTAVETTADDEQFGAYLRSVVVHSLVVRLRHQFVVHGLGDDRGVLAHVRLPLQFGDEFSDVVTLCERGSGGDGTTRAFLEAFEEAVASMRSEGFLQCPNAESDRLLRDVHGRGADLDAWRRRDPRDRDWVEQLAGELGVNPETQLGALQVALRFIYGEERAGAESFQMFDLFDEVQRVRTTVVAAIGRAPTAWELVSSVVRRAGETSSATPSWSRLLAAYGGLEDAPHGDNLAPTARLADQAYRISASLCGDGCQACLHTGSDLMDDALLGAAVSRSLLERLWAAWTEAAPT